jgi:hypothetical protein
MVEPTQAAVRAAKEYFANRCVTMDTVRILLEHPPKHANLNNIYVLCTKKEDFLAIMPGIIDQQYKGLVEAAKVFANRWHDVKEKTRFMDLVSTLTCDDFRKIADAVKGADDGE